MKLNEVKDLLADKIAYYTTTNQREENGEKFEFEYQLRLDKQSPEFKLLTALFSNEVFKELNELEVNYIGCDRNGFIISIKGEDVYKLFEEINRKHKIPLTITKNILTE